MQVLGCYTIINSELRHAKPEAIRAHHLSRRLKKKQYKAQLAGHLDSEELRLWVEWCLAKEVEYSRRRNLKRPAPPLPRGAALYSLEEIR